MTWQYKCVLLVGATSGIGAAMADKFVEAGSKVIAVGRRQDRLDAFVKKHGAERAAGVRFDVTDQKGMDDFVTNITKSYPDLDCVFLNAGIQAPADFRNPGTVDLAAFHNVIHVNFTCLVDLSVKFLPVLQAKPQPTALLVTNSIISLVPAVTVASYSASKAALHAFIVSLQETSKAAQARTKIVDIWPPMVQTELHDYLGEERGRSLGMPVDVFTQDCFRQLEEGKDLIVVGDMYVASQEELMEIVERKQKITQKLAAVMLANF